MSRAQLPRWPTGSPCSPPVPIGVVVVRFGQAGFDAARPEHMLADGRRREVVALGEHGVAVDDRPIQNRYVAADLVEEPHGLELLAAMALRPVVADVVGCGRQGLDVGLERLDLVYRDRAGEGLDEHPRGGGGPGGRREGAGTGQPGVLGRCNPVGPRSVGQVRVFDRRAGAIRVFGRWAGTIRVTIGSGSASVIPLRAALADLQTPAVRGCIRATGGACRERQDEPSCDPSGGSSRHRRALPSKASALEQGGENATLGPAGVQTSILDACSTISGVISSRASGMMRQPVSERRGEAPDGLRTRSTGEIVSAGRGNHAITALVALAIACGGSSSPPSPSSELGTTACDHYVGALLGLTCNYGLTLPASEVARLQQSFVPVCNAAKQAPGSTLTDAQLDACASALEAQCDVLGPVPTPETCNFRGSLAAGEPCRAGPQCASGFCAFPVPGAAPDGGTSDAGLPAGACGTCVAPAALGQPCPYGLCAASAACQSDRTLTQFLCVADTPGGPQEACGQVTGACRDGLTCDASTGLCEPTQWVGAGTVCSMGAERCMVGLYCSDKTGNTCTPPLPMGHACDPAFDLCQLGLTCLGDCVAPTWVADGQPVTTSTSFCLHGFTPQGGGGVCPTLLADGQPCDGPGAGACDDFRQCVNGTCQVVSALSCNMGPLPWPSSP